MDASETKMNDGVKLLLERIKTHPEEFVIPNGGLFVSSRWSHIIAHYESYLTADDRLTLREAMNEVMADKFTEAIMKELMGSEDDGGKLSSPQLTGMHSGGQTQAPYMAQSSQSALAQIALAQQQQRFNSAMTGATVMPLSGGTSSNLPNGGKSTWEKFKKWLLAEYAR